MELNANIYIFFNFSQLQDTPIGGEVLAQDAQANVKPPLENPKKYIKIKMYTKKIDMYYIVPIWIKANTYFV